jgi:uncharacterized protein YpmB
MNARKIIFVIAICGIICFVAICAVAIYFLQAKEKKDNTDRTEKARAARWPGQKKDDGESFKDLEQIVENESNQNNKLP